jgi:hypothetical protein
VLQQFKVHVLHILRIPVYCNNATYTCGHPTRWKMQLQRSGTVPGVGLVHAPLSLLPSPFPRQTFSQAIELAPLFKLLTDRVSQDAEFLQQTLARYVLCTCLTHLFFGFLLEATLASILLLL